MIKLKSLYKAIISFVFLVSFVISSTASYAEIVGRLSVHWSPKHHSAKHAQIFLLKCPHFNYFLDQSTHV